jgi:hypothetical protein
MRFEMVMLLSLGPGSFLQNCPRITKSYAFNRLRQQNNSRVNDRSKCNMREVKGILSWEFPFSVIFNPPFYNSNFDFVLPLDRSCLFSLLYPLLVIMGNKD